jgi:hypothetical protein
MPINEGKQLHVGQTQSVEEELERESVTEYSEEAARAELRAIVEDLDGIRSRLVDLHARLPVPSEEAAMLAGDVEMDFSTEVRSTIECILNDNLRPAIRDLAAAASNHPKRKGTE